jgi:hypothetical protein
VEHFDMMSSKRERRPERGQSLVELALFVPVLLFMVIGMAELGVFFSVYIDVLDSSRAAARYVSPLDPYVTRCYPFESVSFSSTSCSGAEYAQKAQDIKSWGAETIYDACAKSDTLNFFYVAGCLALRNTPKGFLDPANGFDDIIVTTVPITTSGQIVSTSSQPVLFWSFFGNQPTTASSVVVTVTDRSTLAVDILPSFASSLNYGGAPSTGMVVVEVYHAHPQLTKLYYAISRLLGSGATIPDPIPVHTYTIFPLPAVEPK